MRIQVMAMYQEMSDDHVLWFMGIARSFSLQKKHVLCG
jgi:hypothetical protein